LGPLKPEFQAFVDQAKAAGMPPNFVELGAQGARDAAKAMGSALGSGGAPMQREERLTIPGPVGEIPARLFVPGGDLLALVVFYHGGGWVLNDLDGYDAMCRDLAQGSNCAVLSVDYRVAPEHPFPAPVEDCYAAFLWADQNCVTLLGRKLPLVLAGDSAGGNLTAVVALAARDRKGPPVALQVMIYPITDCDLARPSYVENADNALMSSDMMFWFWDQYAPDLAQRANPLISPMRAADLSGLPPALVEVASHDPLRDEGLAYGEKLKSAGVQATVRTWDGAFHGFLQMGSLLPASAEALAVIAEDIRQQLSGQPHAA